MPQQLRVWKGRFNLAMQDPDMQSPRYHTILFVEEDSTGIAGYTHHVTGDITSIGGMRYEKRYEAAPETRSDFHSKELLGYTEPSMHPQAWDEVLGKLPTPPRQKAYNVTSNKTEPVKVWEPLTFYLSGEVRKPLVKCTEWIEQSAIPALEAQGLVKKLSATAS